MIDTHSHIYGPEFDEDRTEVVARAQEAGVERILLPNIDKASITPMLNLCRDYLGYCYPMMGLHPTELTSEWKSDLEMMHQLLLDPAHPYIAVGEVGLDFYRDRTYAEEQQQAFEEQICWARDLGLPLVIHARSAQKELVEAMNRHRDEGLTGIFHCFGGTVDEAQELLQFPGFCLGIGGVLTYKKSTLPEVVRNVPISRIVLETDAPYLAPVPHRGKRNESAYVADTCLRVAQELGMTPQEVSEATNDNVYSIFTRLNLRFCAAKR